MKKPKVCIISLAAYPLLAGKDIEVAGGAELILNAVSVYIEESHGVKVNKFALDTSPGMLAFEEFHVILYAVHAHSL
jgi:hypothetical protein